MGAYGVFQHSIAAEKRKECAALLVQRQRAAVARRSVRAAHDHGVEQRHEPRAVDQLQNRIESNRIGPNAQECAHSCAAVKCVS